MKLTRPPMREAAEERIWIDRARAGDREAYGELVRAHFPRVYAFLHRLVDSHEDAEDLAQETFVRAHRSLAFYRAEASFSTWLARIALHLVQDQRRARGARAPLAPLEAAAQAPEPRPTPGESAGGSELLQRVTEAVRLLPPRLRAALVLRAIEGRDYDEVARITGVRPQTARSQVSEARRLLARSLGRYLEEPSA